MENNNQPPAAQPAPANNQGAPRPQGNSNNRFRRPPRGGRNSGRPGNRPNMGNRSGRPGQGGRNEIVNEENRPAINVPEIDPGVIRIIPLGGVEEIGKNMTAIEFEDTIIVIDAGLEFPGEDTPGVDYIIPDTTYLEQRKHKVKAMIVTHGHLDHIGGIPYVMEKIGNPIIYTSLLTAVMMKKRQEEFPHMPALNIQVLNRDEDQKIGSLSIQFFAATHTIPDSVGVVVNTPFGKIICTGDIKINHKNGTPEQEEVDTFSKLAEGNNLVLIADSTNVWKSGFSYSEKEVH